MHIGVVMDSFNIGGVQSVFYNLISEWSKEGHDVTVFVYQNKGNLKNRLLSNIKVIPFTSSRLYKSFFVIPNLLRKYNIEILLTAKDGINLFYILNKLTFQYNTKLVISQHNHLIFENQFNKKFYKVIIQFLIKNMYKRADYIICVSHSVDLFLKKQGIGNKMKTIYNPLNIYEVLEKSLETPHVKYKYLLYCGRFSTVKNLFFLIDSFSHFHKKNPNYKLLLVGDGPLKSDLEIYVNERKLNEEVIFTGSQSNPYGYMKKAELLILSSFSEALPMVCLEAMSLGITIVSTPCEGPSEILSNDLGYISADFHDAQNFANLMEYALYNKKDPSILKAFVSKFGVIDISKEYINVFKNIIHGSN